MYVVLAGGVGGSRFVSGLVRAIPPEQVTVVVNTGDDLDMYGLHISPDIDINLYTLAGVLDPIRKWGWREDTFVTQQVMAQYYEHRPCFNLGDRDLATHLLRTMYLHQGLSLTAVTDLLRQRLGVRARVLPMTDQPVATYLQTSVGRLHFQSYLIEHRMEPAIHRVEFQGLDRAVPAPGVLEAIAAADAIFLPPSNPVVSVGPILALPGVREALAQKPVIGVSPLIDGKPVKGPADRMLRDLGGTATAAGIAAWYGALLDGYIMDEQDRAAAAELHGGLRVHVMDTLMTTPEAAEAVARAAIVLSRQVGGKRHAR
ncbi:MAG TPA: 2-phospho-L-lactate transferase [Symbiobacteriaceae bacterium]|nr:2-phospho-L-lactate transferase [Symbiobacteriaceae bacterium]